MGQIRIHHLGKAYRQYPSRWARLREWLSIGGQPRHQQRWVLQDIDLEIQPGEAVGIVGSNGAGKSTLLKIITGTTAPTLRSRLPQEIMNAAATATCRASEPSAAGETSMRLARAWLTAEPPPCPPTYRRPTTARPCR